jgi:hypothetical protein
MDETLLKSVRNEFSDKGKKEEILFPKESGLPTGRR